MARNGKLAWHVKSWKQPLRLQEVRLHRSTLLRQTPFGRSLALAALKSLLNTWFQRFQPLASY